MLFTGQKRRPQLLGNSTRSCIVSGDAPPRFLMPFRRIGKAPAPRLRLSLLAVSAESFAVSRSWASVSGAFFNVTAPTACPKRKPLRPARPLNPSPRFEHRRRPGRRGSRLLAAAQNPVAGRRRTRSSQAAHQRPALPRGRTAMVAGRQPHPNWWHRLSTATNKGAARTPSRSAAGKFQTVSATRSVDSAVTVLSIDAGASDWRR